MYGMWFTDAIVTDDINWYEMELVFMIMLIKNDVIDDNIDMKWCYYYW